ncbi:MAG: rhodanese-like domain-containing protein [Micrococcales bacterium]|nr:rhodanese-like domain-containing protein [Micrococcales bacterium]
MSHVGEVSPTDAWNALTHDPRAVLVDVRTRAEWSYVGIPDLTQTGKDLVLIEWQTYPDGTVNPHFTDQLAAAGIEHDQPVYFLCRSGARSRWAAEAAIRAGWDEAYNVVEGFEGPPDAARHRVVSGWKTAGLPWVQG